MTANQRLTIVAATIAALIWAGTTVAAWIDGTPFAVAALIAAGILATAAVFAAAIIAALDWAMRGRR